jgi:hypothetical protein
VDRVLEEEELHQILVGTGRLDDHDVLSLEPPPDPEVHLPVREPLQERDAEGSVPQLPGDTFGERGRGRTADDVHRERSGRRDPVES